jgi:hypothetical protein
MPCASFPEETAIAFDALETEVVEADTTGAQAYTSCSLDPMTNELKGRGLRRIGLSLFPAYPPVIGHELKNRRTHGQLGTSPLNNMSRDT